MNATDTIWILLLARFYNKEKIGILEAVAVLILMAGTSIVVSAKVKTLQSAAFLPIFANLFSPFIGAVCITTLRKGVLIMFDKGNILNGSTTKIEFTAIKLTCAATTAFVCSLVLENGRIHLTNNKTVPWWDELLHHYPFQGTALVLASGLLTFTLHVNNAWLSLFVSSTGHVFLHEVRVFPQWGFNVLFAGLGVKGLKVDLSTQNLVGAIVGLFGAAFYAMITVVTSWYGRLVLRGGQLTWVMDEQEAQGEGRERSDPLAQKEWSSASFVEMRDSFTDAPQERST